MAAIWCPSGHTSERLSNSKKGTQCRCSSRSTLVTSASA